VDQNPLEVNYGLINSADPNAGLIIQYLPYVKSSINVNNVTITN